MRRGFLIQPGDKPSVAVATKSTNPEQLGADSIVANPPVEPVKLRFPTRQEVGKLVCADLPPSQCDWAVYLDLESMKNMLWGMGELFIRCHDVTLANFKGCNQRAFGGFMSLYLLGKQGFMHGDQFYKILAPGRGDVHDLTEMPKPEGRKRTMYEVADLEVVAAEAAKQTRNGKYSDWWKGDVETVLVAIWCIGGLVAEPLGTELTNNQKNHIDLLEGVYRARGKNINEDPLRESIYAFLKAEVRGV